MNKIAFAFLMVLTMLSCQQRAANSVEIVGPRHTRHAVRTQIIGSWKCQAWLNGTTFRFGDDAIDVGLRLSPIRLNVAQLPMTEMYLQLAAGDEKRQVAITPVLHDCLEMPAGHDFIRDSESDVPVKQNCWQVYLEDPFKILRRNHGRPLPIGRYRLEIELRLDKGKAAFKDMFIEIQERRPES